MPTLHRRQAAGTDHTCLGQQFEQLRLHDETGQAGVVLGPDLVQRLQHRLLRLVVLPHPHLQLSHVVPADVTVASLQSCPEETDGGNIWLAESSFDVKKHHKTALDDEGAIFTSALIKIWYLKTRASKISNGGVSNTKI